MGNVCPPDCAALLPHCLTSHHTWWRRVLELLLRTSDWSRYGCTKWATEVQLQQLHREYGVPVSVFRCGMILAHSR